ncbi:hypothetical protein Pyn_23150 [Prunus yedoensis var. nudiflora]|uniref:Uncharacterized protein n=1 Tax=Prunus yedoensis var. nudiflora TaxID=2094558 RepID=A0A314UJJ2_PRUYE|nr:hypothetical protein Pyn_23150 [Prunus yedoensis var. nudiflora]
MFLDASNAVELSPPQPPTPHQNNEVGLKAQVVMAKPGALCAPRSWVARVSIEGCWRRLSSITNNRYDQLRLI